MDKNNRKKKRRDKAKNKAKRLIKGVKHFKLLTEVEKSISLLFV